MNGKLNSKKPGVTSRTYFSGSHGDVFRRLGSMCSVTIGDRGLATDQLSGSTKKDQESIEQIFGKTPVNAGQKSEDNDRAFKPIF